MSQISTNSFRFGGDIKKGFVVGGTSSGGHLASVAAFRAQKAGIPVIGCFCRVPMVLYYPVAKESWKDMINIMPKDVYTPQVDYGAVVSRPHFSR